MKKFVMFSGSMILAATVIWACKTTNSNTAATGKSAGARVLDAANNLMFPKLYAQNGVVLDQLAGKWQCIRLNAVNGKLMGALNDAQAVPGSLSLSQISPVETLACFVSQNGGESPNLPVFPPRPTNGPRPVAD